MSLNSGSSRISTAWPNTVTCLYQSEPSITVRETRGSRRMFFSRRRAASMFTSRRSPSQSYHVAAVCGEPSARIVAITAGLALRSSASTSGGFGILLSFLAPVAHQPKIRLGERSRPKVRACAFTLARHDVRSCGRDKLVLGHPVVHALGPHGEVAARALDVLRHLLGARHDTEVDQRQTLGLVAQHLVEGSLPRFEIDVRRRRMRKHVPAGEDANASRVACEQRPVVE